VAVRIIICDKSILRLDRDAMSATSHRSFIRDVWAIGLSTLIVGVAGVVSLPVLTKPMGAAGYGVFAILQVTVTLLVPLATLSLDAPIVRFLSAEKDPKKIREGIYSTVMMTFVGGSVLAIVLYLLAAPLAELFLQDTSFAYLFQLTGFWVLATVLEVSMLPFLRAKRWMRKAAFFQGAPRLIEIGLAALYLWLGGGIIGVLIAYIFTRFGSFLGMFGLVARSIGLQMPKLSTLRPYIRYSLPLVPNAFVIWFIHSSNRYLVGYYLGPSEVGIYVAAFMIGFALALITDAIFLVLFPYLSKMHEEGKDADVHRYLRYSIKYYLLVVLPICAAFYAVAGTLITTLTSAQFVEGRAVLPVIATGVVLFGIGKMFQSIFLLHKKTHVNLMLTGTAAAMNIALSVLLIPMMGIRGAAVAALFSYTIFAVTSIAWSREYLKVRIDVVALVKAVAASLVVWIFLVYVSPGNMLYLILSGLVALGIYLFMVLGTGAISVKEMKVILDSLKRE